MITYLPSQYTCVLCGGKIVIQEKTKDALVCPKCDGTVFSNCSGFQPIKKSIQD
ncbi:hypothetical protein [Culicoidibacter larvae]|uniref:hypothetical protein n=1 Tax=Culicoidibacter larvae TaxID=2579976 RepID=UPI0014853A4C|nr:hypothetical protein [Culicoidibacter larvae]